IFAFCSPLPLQSVGRIADVCSEAASKGATHRCDAYKLPAGLTRAIFDFCLLLIPSPAERAKVPGGRKGAAFRYRKHSSKSPPSVANATPSPASQGKGQLAFRRYVRNRIIGDALCSICREVEYESLACKAGEGPA